MKQLLFCITFLFFAAYGQAQFRLAVNGTPYWTSLGGGLYQTTVTFHADLTGNSYAVAGIVDTMRLFTSRGQVFEIDSVWGKTFSQATLRVEYLEGVSSAPVGQGMVYAPNVSGHVPDIPFGSTGATAQFNQMPVTYNAAIAAAGGISPDSIGRVESIIPLTDTTFIVNFVDGTKDTILIPYQTAQETRVSDEDDHFTSTNVEGALAEIGAQLPSEFVVDNTISATDRIHKTDGSGNYETSTVQSWFNQIRDSTIFSAATYSDIRKISTTLKVGDRVLIKDSGVEYLVVADSIAGLAIDGVSCINLSGKYAIIQPRLFETASAREFGITGILADSTKIEIFLDYCKKAGKQPYFPAGTYQFPHPWQYTWDSTFLHLTGDGIGKTIFTTAVAEPRFRNPIWVDATKPAPTTDGVYKIDIVGPTNHSSYTGVLGATILTDTFVLIQSGAAVRYLNRDSVATRGYLAEVRWSDSEPAADGLYVVVKAQADWTGSADGTTTAWSDGIPLIAGTVIKNTGGAWTWWNRDTTVANIGNGAGIIFKGDAVIEGISFREFANIPLSPWYESGKIHKDVLIQNCEFRNTHRVTSLASTGSSGKTTQLYPFKVYGAASSTFTDFVFDKFEFKDNIISYVSDMCVASLGFVREWNIIGNHVSNVANVTAIFSDLPAQEMGLITRKFVNNTLIDNRSKELYSRSNIILYRSQYGNCLFQGNKFYRNTGLHAYLGGDGNLVSDNYVEAFRFSFSGNGGSVFFFKGSGGVKMGKGSNEVKNNTVVSAANNPAFSVVNSRQFTIQGNTFRGLAAYRVIDANTTALFIDEKHGYFVADTARFYYLVGRANAAASLAPRTFVYKNYQTNLWTTLTVGNTSASLVYSPEDTTAYIVKILDNTIEAYTAIECNSTKPIRGIDLDNNTIEGTSAEFSVNNRTINTLRFRGNKIYKYLANGASNNVIVGNAEYIGNDYYLYYAQPAITATNITFNHNNVFGMQTHTLLALTNLTSPPAQSSWLFNSSNNTTITHNYFDGFASRTQCLSVTTSDSLLISNNVFDNAKEAVNFVNYRKRGVAITASNHAVVTKNTFKLYSDSQSYPLEIGGNLTFLDFSLNKVVGYKPLYLGVGAFTITTLNNTLNSWEPATGVISGATITNTNGVKLGITPEGVAQKTIAYTSDLTAYLPLAGGTLTGHLLFTDNTYDIGASGATRPRTGYFGTSVVTPTVNATTALQVNGTNINTLYAALGGNNGQITLGSNTAGLNLESDGTRRMTIPEAGIANTPTSTKALVLSSNDSLGYTTMQSSDWTNTVTQSGSDTLQNSAIGYGHFQRVGNYVTFTLRIEIALTITGDANTVYINPPIASNFVTAATDVIGVASMDTQGLSSLNIAHQRCLLFASDSDDKIGISFDPVAALTYPSNRVYISVSGSYIIQ